MARISAEAINRRVASIAAHLSPALSGSSGSLELCNSSMNDSYRRVHGEVSSQEVEWKVMDSDSDSSEAFTDIVYEKAVGEGIAKVSS